MESNGSEIDLSYDKRGRVEKMTMENGREVAWKYNKNGQVEQVADSKIKSFFQYDDLGRVKTVDTEDGNHVDFEYDAMDNIVKAKDKYHDVAFSYSPTGRILSRSENNTEIQFLYDKNDQLLSITNEHKNIYHFKRDELGNLIEESGYDGLKREYRRNAGGNVEKVITPDHKITNYTYDTLGNISKIIHDDKSEELFTYDKNGQKVWSCELDIYGKVRSIEGKRSFIPFRYQGQYHDHETGLYYNRFRYYCTDIGTFISQDPIGLAGGMPNMYSYVHDVGAYLDPLGLFETLTIVRVFTENSQTGVHYYAYFTNSKGKSMFTHLSGDDLGTKIVTKENTMVNLDDIADENKRVIRVNKKGKNKKKMIENAIKSIVESGQFNQKVWDMDAGIDCFRYLQRLIEKINPSVHVHGDDFYNRFDKLPNQCK
ncbi:RHS repeat domain-containing protein [Aureivirga marina]|uniref:RHS repeat domain-containing protein n=1 Tax=Aureivirga marina TaxID=1182451 RepID=UPI0018CB6D0A|nr:RHS repeat-associated core domain-containing protein [Aureivirga marina]